MPGFECRFRDRIPRQYACPLCKNPMREPVQITSCGHHFCDTCLQEYLSAGVFECPEDRFALDYAKIYPDDKMEGEIMSLNVRCQFYKDGCKWTDQLRSLQAHLESCQYNMVSCSECSAMVSRTHMKDHLKYDCQHRQSVCEFCGREFQGQRMESHVGRCQLEEVFCENKCGAEVQRRFINNHMLNECPKRQIPCKYCHKEFIFETLQSHLHQCPRYPISCPNRCETSGGKVPREDLEKHVKDSCPSAVSSCPFREHGCKYRGPKYGIDTHLESNMKAHLNLTCQMVRRQQRIISDLRMELDYLNLSTDGVLLWKIANYNTKLQKAKNDEAVELCSPGFLTSRHGYKLQVSIFLNGNGSGEGTHLSIYIRVLCGDYDNILKWPFTYPITFTLLDQSDDPISCVHVKECFTPDPTWKNFQKPSKDVHMLGYGYPTFVAQSFLKTRNYLKDDTLFVRVNVDCSKIIQIY